MLRLITLGSAAVERGGVPLSGRATQRRRLALLALLAGARGHGVPRDKLLAYLWPERDVARARHSLSQSLYELRRDLDADAFVAGVDEVRLNPAVWTSDVAELLDAAAAGDDRRVVALHTGSFLDGFHLEDAPEFERWCDDVRREVDAAHAAALDALARAALHAGDAAGAVDWLRRRASADPLHSRVALDLGRALAGAGDPAGALRYLRGHVRLLREELGMAPGPELSALMVQLRVVESSGAPLRSPGPGGAGSAVAGSPPESGTAETAPATPAPTGDAPHASAAAAASPSGSARLSGPTTPAPERRVAGPWTRRRTAVMAAAGVVALAAVVLAGNAPGAAPGRAPLLVLGDIAGPDSVLALAVSEAIRAEIEATSELRVLGEGPLQEALRLMTVGVDARRTTGIAMQVARRTGASVVVGGSVVPLGTGVQLVVRALDVRTGAVLASVAERPDRAEDVVRAVARVARSLREELTGSAPAPGDPLPAVTTASLEALTRYALARRALLRLDRAAAVDLAESALVHDSAFALAHYLLADQLWYLDRQRHSDEHMLKAMELSDGLPPRERLVVKARHAQLILDRPDSALVFWRLLASSHPGEPLAWEGMRWAHRALGEWGPMIAASDSAHRLDPTWNLPYIEDRLRGFLLAGDSAGLVAFARSEEGSWPGIERISRFNWAFEKGDYERALELLGPEDRVARHNTLLALGDLAEGRRHLESLRETPMQHYPRALLVQARAEVGPGGSRELARDLARRAFEWLEAADLSPPAYARLAERVADVAARTADAELMEDTRALLVEKDDGRGLPSYRAALRGLDAGEAFLRGDAHAAAELAAEAGLAMYYGRSTSLIVMLEADARRALGQNAAAARLYRDVLAPDAFREGDTETRAVVRRFARAALADMEG